MAWIDEKDLKQIASQADIVDIVGNYVDLEKKGKNFRGICPFHDDHDPSMQVNPQRQIFKCFVCGTGGNVFTFVQKMEQIPFVQAVYKVADLIHYPLKRQAETMNVQASPYQPLYNALTSYIQFLTYELGSEDGIQALAYCKSRKISPELIKTFEIGYAPASRQSLHYLNSKKISRKDQMEAGLIYEDSQDSQAVFVNRLMIPIHDPQGHPVGFTARRLNDQSDEAKYINTRQTVVYDKSHLIFNYHRAKAPARKSHRVILCEGAMDVIAFAKAGLPEAIANLGTACTDEQIQLISALRVPVVVCYDADRAGRDACYKFAQKAAGARIPFTIVQSGKLKDPDEVFLAQGAQGVKEMVENTISYVQFLFDYLPNLYNLNNYEDKKTLALLIQEAISSTCQEFEKAAYLLRLKELTGFDFQTSAPARKERKKTRPAFTYIPDVRQGIVQAEQLLLQLMLSSRILAARFQDEIGFFPDEDYQTLSLYIYDFYRSHDRMDTLALLSAIEDDAAQQLLLALLEDPLVLEEDQERFFQDGIAKLKEAAISAQIEILNTQISQATSLQEKMALAQSKQDLISRRLEIHLQKEGYPHAR